MLRLLARRIKDMDLLNLFNQLFDTYHIETGKGMPIGNLISQHLANFYLGCFDHWIKEERKIIGYVRYMDDMLVFGDDRESLKTELAEIRQYLHSQLDLQVKESVEINRCRNGVTFLGYRVFPDAIRLSSGSRRRFSSKFRLYEDKWLYGEWSMDELVRHMEPLVDFTRAAGAAGLRRKVISRFGVSP